MGITLAAALPMLSLDVVGLVAGYALCGSALIYTSHQSEDVRVWTWTDDSDTCTHKFVRKISGGDLKKSFGLWVHAGLLYVGSWQAQSCIHVFNVNDGRFVRAIGSGLLSEPVGVTVVGVPE